MAKIVGTFTNKGFVERVVGSGPITSKSFQAEFAYAVTFQTTNFTASLGSVNIIPVTGSLPSITGSMPSVSGTEGQSIWFKNLSGNDVQIMAVSGQLIDTALTATISSTGNMYISDGVSTWHSLGSGGSPAVERIDEIIP